MKSQLAGAAPRIQEPHPPTIADAPVSRGAGSSFLVTLTLAALTTVYLLAALIRSRQTHFWLDEVLAVSTARLPSFSAIADAIWNGAEFSPPTYEFLLHIVMAAFGPTSLIAPRLPSILALLAAAFALFRLVRREYGPAGALVTFALVLDSGLFDFAVQARQYALLAMGTALGLLLWDRAHRSSRAPVHAAALWAVLAVCVSLHFYGILCAAVIGIAEVVWTVTRRRVRWPVWIALAATVPVILAWSPLAAHLAQFNAGDTAAPGFYGKPTPQRFVGAITDVIVGGQPGTILYLAIAVMFLIAVMGERFGYGLGTPHAPARHDRDDHALSQIEIAMVALGVLPIVAFLFSFLVTRTFSPRYMSAAALFPPMVIGYCVSRSSVGRLVAIGTVLATLGLLPLRTIKPDPIEPSLAIVRSMPPGPPIVIGEGLLYVELMEAVDPALRPRLVYLLKRAGDDSPDPTNENIIRRILPFHPDYTVAEQSDFLGRTPRFSLLARTKESTDTTTPSLLSQGVLGRPVRDQGNVWVFDAGRR